VKRLTLFITGTDTGAGKTVLACLLARHLRAKGFSVAALKPVCSGGRGDAKALHAVLGGALTVDEINPWHFQASLAPLLAARVEKSKVKLPDVVAHARRMQSRFPILIIEGAGGVLSPLGEDFDSRDLITALRAVPVVVCPNRLGAINQVLLALTSLPLGLSRKAQVVLVARRKPQDSSEGNLLFLGKKLGRSRVHQFPWLENRRADRQAFEALNSLVRSIDL
jgi:dethiobiotin synthetase